MKRTRNTLRLAAVASASALVLAACGGGGGSDDDAGDSTEIPEGDGVLTIGSLLPQTGDLSFLGPPEFAGVDLAIQEINEAGGVLGQEVKGVKADSGDGTPNIAPGETDKLLNADADVIVGAAASGVSLAVIDKIVGAGVLQISPANTSTTFDEYDDKGLYFRTAPSDILQGAVMANLLAEDGAQNVAILARQDAYGEALSDQIEQVFTDAGGTVAAKVLYDANASTFGSEVQEVANSNPDAIVLVAFNETTKIIPELISAGVGPQDVQTYFVDGNTADYSADLPPGTLEGVRATYPGAELSDEFRERLLSIDPNLDSFTYGPESYDAVILVALAAIAADNDSGQAIASEMQNVSADGTKCTTFAECKELLEQGEDIDYDGVSGPIEFGDTGSITAASIGIFQYNAENTFEPVEFKAGQI
ncbi:amino acid ABC transporter substrate-binding protein [Aeromicrobium phragmitis]|uniref:Amino acid ABC transporter substrate-binding protein n=1 Tax=Aeromicrobium phragmitis TaxID=2478914 RepID=A0A3L8PIQ9_9ACTN|nr:ABC transporter substrate-binding protein [Aeromicrobium phragmitis]RLV55217.1 amino acid ABC transporter substrate-binding protein [Aeromicrobium phragmitis]